MGARKANVNAARSTSRASARAKPLSVRPANRGGQVTRQLSVLRALEATRRGLTPAQLHEAVDDGISARTIYRYIEQLQQAGFPLVEEDGRWKVTAPSLLQATPLQPSEVFALLISENLLTPGTAAGLGLALRELRKRLMASLSTEGRAFVHELRSSYLATLAAPALDAPAIVLEAIDDACGREHCLRISYRSPGKTTSNRVVEPHLFWVHDGRAYVVAYCRTKQDFRTFAAQRIASAEVLDEAFERRTEFDASSFTSRGFGILHGEIHDVRVEFAPQIAHLASERQWHPSQRIEPTAQGGAVLHMTVAGLPEVAAWIASFGGKLRALAPAELVTAVRDVCARGAAAHAARPLR